MSEPLLVIPKDVVVYLFLGLLLLASWFILGMLSWAMRETFYPKRHFMWVPIGTILPMVLIVSLMFGLVVIR